MKSPGAFFIALLFIFLPVRDDADTNGKRYFPLRGVINQRHKTVDAASLGLAICDCKERPVCQLTYGSNLSELSTTAGIEDIFLSGSKYKDDVTEFVVLYGNSENNVFINEFHLSLDDLDEAYFELPPNQYLNEPFEVISGIVKVSANSSVTK